MTSISTRPKLDASARDTSRPILLIGFLQQGNLGLGYLSSVLRANGYTVVVADIERDPNELAALARSLNPLIIGLSLIFQFYIPSLWRAGRPPSRNPDRPPTSPWAAISPASPGIRR